MTGLLLLFPALIRLADVLGADLSETACPRASSTWTSAIVAGVSLYAARASTRRSVC